MPSLRVLNQTISDCTSCSRLVGYRQAVARTKRRQYTDCTYWGRPVSELGWGEGALLAAIIASLVVGAWPAIEKYGLDFMTSTVWDPVTEEFGGLVMIYGTIATSLIALIIAVPVSFGIALFLTELSPAWLKRPLGTAIELLASSLRWGSTVPKDLAQSAALYRRGAEHGAHVFHVLFQVDRRAAEHGAAGAQLLGDQRGVQLVGKQWRWRMRWCLCCRSGHCCYSGRDIDCSCRSWGSCGTGWRWSHNTGQSFRFDARSHLACES